MFGYVHIDKLELKMKDYLKYKGYYCGLCLSLKEHYGNVSRLTLNYDMTYLILILSSLYEPDNSCDQKRCFVHPQNKQLVIKNSMTEYAAALNVLLAYNNIKDDWMDEHSIKALISMLLFRRAYKKARDRFPDKENSIVEHMKQLQELEKENCGEIDRVANVFGNLMGDLILYKEDHWASYLRNIGFYLGKYIYILDAYDDLEKDRKKKCYNPFIYCEEEDIRTYAKQLLDINLSFLHNEIDKLPLIREIDILDNIIYSGIRRKMDVLFGDSCEEGCSRRP